MHWTESACPNRVSGNAGDAAGVVVTNNTYQAYCQDDHLWRAPFCRDTPSHCILYLSTSDGWGLSQCVQRSVAYNLPIAFGVAEWNDFVEIPKTFACFLAGISLCKPNHKATRIRTRQRFTSDCQLSIGPFDSQGYLLHAVHACLISQTDSVFDSLHATYPLNSYAGSGGFFYWWTPDDTFLELSPKRLIYPAPSAYEWSQGIFTTASLDLNLGFRSALLTYLLHWLFTFV